MQNGQKMSLLFGTFLIIINIINTTYYYFPLENLGLFERRHPELGLGTFFLFLHSSDFVEQGHFHPWPFCLGLDIIQLIPLFFLL